MRMADGLVFDVMLEGKSKGPGSLLRLRPTSSVSRQTWLRASASPLTMPPLTPPMRRDWHAGWMPRRRQTWTKASSLPPNRRRPTGASKRARAGLSMAGPVPMATQNRPPIALGKWRRQPVMHHETSSACRIGAPSRREVLAPIGEVGLLPALSGILPAPLAAAVPTPSAGASVQARAFDLADVTLLDGPFRHAQRRTAAYLLSLQPDRLLHGFLVNAGLRPKAPIYGGWESEPLWADIHCQGHTLGHYLSACSLMYRSAGDRRFKRLVDHCVAELAACQATGGTGLIKHLSRGIDARRSAHCGREDHGRALLHATQGLGGPARRARADRAASGRAWCCSSSPTGRWWPRVSSPMRSSRRCWRPSMAA